MKNIRIISPAFPDSVQELEAQPLTVPDEATFPDGMPITAYRVLSALMVGADTRLYALRYGAELFVFANTDEAATIAATVATAQVDNGFQITPCMGAYLTIDKNEGITK